MKVGVGVRVGVRVPAGEELCPREVRGQAVELPQLGGHLVRVRVRLGLGLGLGQLGGHLVRVRVRLGLGLGLGQLGGHLVRVRVRVRVRVQRVADWVRGVAA